MTQLHILGTSDEQTVCDMCGRMELKLTVIIADEDNEITGRYGTSCVDIVLNNGKRRTTAAKAREIEECRKDAIYTNLSHFTTELSKDFGYAMTFMVSAIAAHNLIPVPSTAKAINARLDKLAAKNPAAANAMRGQIN
jgi:Pyruvate/2-oxoacid:ferredoxin oxidoreductase gamma subunit